MAFPIVVIQIALPFLCLQPEEVFFKLTTAGHKLKFHNISKTLSDLTPFEASLAY